ncbi:ABC transporter, periplasmic substrate-binding protein [Campylobacter mucosalis]|uniref:substrate-binding domain-containing protein n=1 Tax=Campylobacter mucosalis TaxID=202 RepID=UPI000689418C|nr:substrate-binding domain-containing protein [Campylobacter mucosalis]QKF62554.1 ABC transporter, periplasmic substrate-binding protein [Campylobacter mucosalis]
MQKYTEIYGDGAEILRVATGSPGELGLLKKLSEVFNSLNDSKICWIKAGSSDGLELLKENKVDVTMTHSPLLEKTLIKQGIAKKRTLIGSNEFFIIGPKDDPAGIKTAKTATEAYSKIAKANALFYTRSDGSGTHIKELDIWQKAGIKPSGSWYVQNRDFMIATLKRADDTNGYFMSDSSTYYTIKNELKNSEILFSGDKILVNVYATMCRIDAPKIAENFIDFLADKKSQEIFKTYGRDKFGIELYNDAKYAREFFIK